jgi:hypothetical protein
MAKCDSCGNDYDKSFQIVAQGKTHTFDSFECAIHKLAPKAELPVRHRGGGSTFYRWGALGRLAKRT